MPFYIYERREDKAHEHFKQAQEVPLAGHNVIYQLWGQNGKPLDKGWHISIHDLLRIIAGGTGTSDSLRLLIDSDPKAKRRIAIAEILDIYVYTYGNSVDKAIWSALMLRLREVCYEDLDRDENPEEIAKMKYEFSIDKRMDDPDKDIYEFLYLHGDDRSWVWGRVGQVNAVFIYKDARDYFKELFCK
jgi:hypothetical protein